VPELAGNAFEDLGKASNEPAKDGKHLHGQSPVRDQLFRGIGALHAPYNCCLADDGFFLEPVRGCA
jgi:hypothetical protein